MTFVLTDLPKDAPSGTKAVVENIHEFLKDQGFSVTRLRSIDRAEAQVSGALAVVVFPEFWSEHARAAVDWARRAGIPVVFYQCGGGSGFPLGARPVRGDRTIPQMAFANGSEALRQVLEQIEAKSPVSE